MKTKIILIFAMLTFVSCQRCVTNINLKLSKQKHTEEVMSHFPKKVLSNKSVFNEWLNPNGDMIPWGPQLMVKYRSERQRDKYLNEALMKLVIDTVVVDDGSILMEDCYKYIERPVTKSKARLFAAWGDEFEEVSEEYLKDSVLSKKILPYPNLKEEVYYMDFADSTLYSDNPSDYIYYVLEQLDTVYTNQKTLIHPVLYEKLNHGVSRGIVENKKNKTLLFWTYFW